VANGTKALQNMCIYMGTLIRSVIGMHNLIENKVRRGAQTSKFLIFARRIYRFRAQLSLAEAETLAEEKETEKKADDTSKEGKKTDKVVDDKTPKK